MNRITRWTRTLTGLAAVLLALAGLATPATTASASVTFVRHGAFPAGDSPTDAVAADFDEDGDADVTVGNITELGGGVSTLFNDGAGNLGDRRLESLGGVVVGPGKLQLGDFDRDGHVDITAVADDVEVEVLFGDGTGRFEQHGFRVDGTPRVSAPLNLNGDGRPDLAVATSENGLFVLRNDGARGFGSPLKFPISLPRHLASADLDGDADEDLVVTELGGRTHIMRNNGSGLLVEGHVFFATFDNASAIVPADVDGDADVDLSVGDTRGFVHVFVNDGQGEFFPISVPPVPTAPMDMDGGDLDSDGDIDLVVVSSGSAHEDAEDFLSILFNDGSGRMSAGPRVAAGNDPRGVAVARLDGDARPDVALTSIDDDTVEVYLNRTPPLTASAGPDVPGIEGSPISLNGTATEGAAVSWRVVPESGVDSGGTCTFSDSRAAATALTCTDDGTYRATITASRDFAKVADDVVVTVSNARPTISNLTVTRGETACVGGNQVGLSFAIDDRGANDTHTANIDWGDGTSPEAFAGSGFAGTHSYAAGRYSIDVSASDDDGASANASAPNAVSLLFAHSDFQAPISMDGSSTFRLGRKVPVKIAVTDCLGNPVSTLHPDVDLTKVSSAVDGRVTDVGIALAADQGDDMRFDEASGQYVFNLATRSSQFCTAGAAMCNGTDLTPGTYELRVTDPTFEPVVTTIQISTN